MTADEGVTILTNALKVAGCDYGSLTTWLIRGGDPEAVKNPQTPERHRMWCTRCNALHLTKDVSPN